MAATDGSVGKDEHGNETMGAGYCFEDYVIKSASFQVGCISASLRAEAAAMWQILVAA